MEFAALRSQLEVLHSFRRPWFVAGGWAIDLFLGREDSESSGYRYRVSFERINSNCDDISQTGSGKRQWMERWSAGSRMSGLNCRFTRYAPAAASINSSSSSTNSGTVFGYIEEIKALRARSRIFAINRAYRFFHRKSCFSTSRRVRPKKI